MEPVPHVLLLIPLVVLAMCVGMFNWIADTMFPDVWRVGEEFGLRPTRTEQLFVRAIKATAVVCGAMWWLFLVAFLFG